MKNLKNSLAKPSGGAQPWAIWIWNLSITRPEIEKQLNALISKGFGGIAVRPGRDMSPGYMSDGFLKNFGVVLEIARQHKIGVRLADDFSILWGGCADNIVSQGVSMGSGMRAEYLVLEREVRESGECEIAVDPEREYIVQAVRRAPKTGLVTEAKPVAVPAGKTSFKWKAPNAEWCLLVYKKEEARDPSGRAVPNLYNPRAAQTYMQNTLDVFRTTFSKYIPNTFEGFITEMPALRPGGNGIFWEDDLVVKYRTKYKRDLLGLLPSVFLDIPGSEKTRIQVHTFIYNYMNERFTSLLEAWAKRYRLSQWVLWPETGIYRPENALRDAYVPETPLAAVGLQNVDGSFDNFAQLRTIADINANLRRRETVTVVGRNRGMAGCSLQGLKREIDLSLLAGPSRILVDGMYFNIDQRNYYKTPYNPSWYSPERDHVKLLCDYSARCQDMLKNLHASCEIAVLSPCDAIMGDYLPGAAAAAAGGFERFQKTVDALCCFGKEFDVVTEELLLTCQIRQNGDFATPDRIRKGNYQALVVPYAPFVSRSLLVFLERLAIKGTTLIFIDESPKGTHEDGSTANVAMRLSKLVAPRRENVMTIAPVDLEHALGVLKPEIALTRESGESADAAAQVFHCYEGGGKIIMLHNLSDTAEQNVIAEVQADKHFAVIDCVTGKITELEPLDVEKNTARLRLSFTPLQTMFIAATPSKISGASSAQEFNPFMLPLRSYRIVFKDQWEFEPQNLNALLLPNWTVRMGMSKDSRQISHFYETTFEIKTPPDHCAFILNGMDNAGIPFQSREIMFNGVRIDNVPRAFDDDPMAYDNPLLKILGKDALAFDLKKRMVKGPNRISIRTIGSSIAPQTLVYPPIITGDFAVSRGPNGWMLDKPVEPIVGHDSWVKYGYPCLSGRARYTQTFEVPNEYDKLVLRFSRTSGAVRVKVNDADIGMLHWHPMELDITELCNTQRNVLSVEVVNTMDNVLRMNARPSGLTGEVYVDVYKS